MTAPENIREKVRQRYAEAATRSAAAEREPARPVETSCGGGTFVSTIDHPGRATETSCCGGAPVATIDDPAGVAGTSCCGPTRVSTTDQQSRVVFGAGLYGPDAAEGAPDAALAASLGCGVPTAVADLHPGEVVLDLGSGAGADVLISARRVAPGGRAIGLDMTTEMLELARRNAAEAGVDNVEFLQGYLEDIPLPDDSVDVVISNCVINLAADKFVVLAEAARVLRPGGRLAFSDVIADEDMDEATKADMAEWTGCIAGALTQTAFAQALSTAGFTDIEIRPTHRVHTHAQSAVVRATQPGPQRTPKGSTMNTIEVFDPAMCCSTGVCGPSVDPELARFEADLRWLAAQGTSVTRHNLAQEPGEFATRPLVAAMLSSGGEDVLPIILVDGKLRFSGTWPSRIDLAAPLGIEIPVERADLLAPAGDTCCTTTEKAATGCCGSAEQTTTERTTEQSTEQTNEKVATGCCGSAEQVREPQDADSGRCC